MLQRHDTSSLRVPESSGIAAVVSASAADTSKLERILAYSSFRLAIRSQIAAGLFGQAPCGAASRVQGALRDGYS